MAVISQLAFIQGRPLRGGSTVYVKSCTVYIHTHRAIIASLVPRLSYFSCSCLALNNTIIRMHSCILPRIKTLLEIYPQSRVLTDQDQCNRTSVASSSSDGTGSLVASQLWRQLQSGRSSIYSMHDTRKVRKWIYTIQVGNSQLVFITHVQYIELLAHKSMSPSYGRPVSPTKTNFFCLSYRSTWAVQYLKLYIIICMLKLLLPLFYRHVTLHPMQALKLTSFSFSASVLLIFSLFTTSKIIAS